MTDHGMTCNCEKLDAELKSAGIHIHGVSSDGRIDFRDDATPAQRSEAQAILAAHDPRPTLAQRLRAKGLTVREAAFVLVLRDGPLAQPWAREEIARLGNAIDKETTA